MHRLNQEPRRLRTLGTEILQQHFFGLVKALLPAIQRITGPAHGTPNG